MGRATACLVDQLRAGLEETRFNHNLGVLNKQGTVLHHATQHLLTMPILLIMVMLKRAPWNIAAALTDKNGMPPSFEGHKGRRSECLII
ncbi:unnamed protein product, partial [Mesorhabditis spiculigera]